MWMLQVLYERRLTSCLGLLGLLALASGCGDEPPSPAAAQQKQQDDKEARLKAYGKAGVQTGKQATPAK